MAWAPRNGRLTRRPAHAESGAQSPAARSRSSQAMAHRLPLWLTGRGWGNPPGGCVDAGTAAPRLRQFATWPAPHPRGPACALAAGSGWTATCCSWGTRTRWPRPDADVQRGRPRQRPPGCHCCFDQRSQHRGISLAHLEHRTLSACAHGPRCRCRLARRLLRRNSRLHRACRRSPSRSSDLQKWRPTFAKGWGALQTRTGRRCQQRTGSQPPTVHAHAHGRVPCRASLRPALGRPSHRPAPCRGPALFRGPALAL